MVYKSITSISSGYSHKPLPVSEKFLAKVTEDAPGYINWADAVSVYGAHVDKLALLCTSVNVRSSEFWEGFRKEIYQIASISHALHLEYAHEEGSSFKEDSENDEDESDYEYTCEECGINVSEDEYDDDGVYHCWDHKPVDNEDL